MTRSFTRAAAVGLALAVSAAAPVESAEARGRYGPRADFAAAGVLGPAYYAGPGYDCAPVGFGAPLGPYGASYGYGAPYGYFDAAPPPVYSGGLMAPPAPRATSRPSRLPSATAASAEQSDPELYYRRWYETR